MRVSGVRRVIDLPPSGGQKLCERGCVPLAAVPLRAMPFADDALHLVEPGGCGQDRVFAAFAVELEEIDARPVQFGSRTTADPRFDRVAKVELRN